MAKPYPYWAIYLIAVFFVNVLDVTAQNERFIDPYFENYTTADRLPFDKFNDGLIDEHGFLWLSSVHGIVKYDGYEFKTFRNNIGEDDALSDGRIANIVFDKHGYMWMGSTQGLSRWDLKTNEVIHLLRDREKYPFLGEKSSTLTIGPEGNLWVSSWHYLNKINVDDLSIKSWNVRKHFFMPEVSFTTNKISFDKLDSNILWVGSDLGLLKFNLSSETYEIYLSPFFVKNEEKLGLKYDFHTYIYADSLGIVYTGRLDKNVGLSRNEGMHAFNSLTEEWKVIKLQPESRVQSVYGIKYKSKDELWVHTENHGLGIFNKKTEKFLFIDHDPMDENTIRRNSVRVSLMDQMDNLFICTVEALSISYNQRNIFKFHRLIPKELVDKRPSIYIKDLLETEKKIYLATHRGGGLLIIDKINNSYKEIPLSKKQGHPWNSAIELIEDHSGMIYIASWNGLKVYDPATGIVEDFKTPTGEKVDLIYPKLFKVIEDYENRIWIGTDSEGLIEISAKRDHIIYHKHDPDVNNSLVENTQIRGLEMDAKNRVWVSTIKGVSCYDPEKKEFTNYSVTELGDQYLGTNNAFNCLTDTLGRVWIGTYMLICIDESKPIGQRQELVTVKDGLPGSYNRTMQRHPDGTFWIITDNGFLHFNPYDHSMKTYTTKEGLGFDQMWNHNFYFSDNTVRVLSKIGYYEYNSEIEKSINKANLAFTGFLIKGKEVPGYTEINGTDTLELGYQQNFVAFKYAMLNFTPKMDNVYSYKMDGVDDDWIEAGKRTYTEYTDLEGGYYTFQVKAKDRLGNEARNVLTKTIFIATPFWKTTWFKGLVALLVASIIYMIYRYRITTIKKEKLLMAQLSENEMIALRAQMNPHFLFNTINSIKRFIIKNETTIAADHLTKFSRLVRLILNNSNSKSIPLRDEVEALRLYIEMEMMRFDDKFAYSIAIEKNLNVETIEIPPMLMQPFVENAIWHGLMHKVDGDGKLNIELKIRDGYLECIIEDNGVGRAKAAEIKSKSAIKKKSLGMSLTQRRIELLDQDSTYKIINLEIEDLSDRNGLALGTKVTIRIPIEKTDVVNEKRNKS